MRLAHCLAVAARKKQVVTLAIAISVVAAVFSSLTAVQGAISTAAAISETLIHPSTRLVASPKGGITECPGTLSVNGSTLKIPVVIVRDNVSLPRVERPHKGNASVGYLLAGPDSWQGRASLAIGARKYALFIGGVHHTNSGLDVSLIVWSRRIQPCPGLRLDTVNASTSPYPRTLAAQLSGLVREWRLAGLAILLAGSVTATVKALGDLAKESLVLEEEGASGRCMLCSLAVIHAASVLSGYAWGWVVAGLADSAVALATGVYLPTPSVDLSNIVEAGVAPSLLVLAASVVAGVVYAVKR